MPQSQSGTPSVGWIKFLAIVTAWLTIILVALIIVLGMFVWRLEVLTDSLVASRRSAQLSSPTAEQSPTPTTEPVLKAIPIATPTMTPSPSPHPTQVPHRTHRRRHREHRRFCSPHGNDKMI